MSTVRMRQLTALVLRRDLYRVTQALILSGQFQPFEASSAPSAPSAQNKGAPVHEPELLDAYRKLEGDVRAVLEQLDVAVPDEVHGEADPSHDLVPIRQAVEEVQTLLSAHHRQDLALREQLRQYEQRVVARQSLTERGLVPARLAHVERLLMRVGWVPSERLGQLREALEPVPAVLESLAMSGSQTLLMTLALPQRRDRVDGALLAIGFQAQPLVDVERPSERDTPSWEEVRGQLGRLAVAYAELRRAWVDRLVEAARRVRMNQLILENVRFALAQGPAVWFRGWVPEPDAETVMGQVQRATDEHCVLTLQSAETVSVPEWGAETVPILYRNPLLLQPFQRLVAAYGQPVYAEVDPTPIFAVSFMLMFGIMFGDMGQGGLVAALGYLLFRRRRAYADVGILLIECGLSSMLFGVLYGNIFGIERDVIPHVWFRPMENVTLFLNVALLFGAGFLSLGFVINIINAVRRRAYAEAVLGKHGMAAALLYWLLAGLLIRYFLWSTSLPAVRTWVLWSVLLLVVTVVVHEPVIRLLNGQRPIIPGSVPAFLLESTIELVDTVSQYVGNTVSFMRVGAFALMHAGLFIVIFTVGDLLARGTGETIWYWVTVALGNIVVIVVEGFIVAIQILRLEYYEFFSKFYSGTGSAFRPMGSRSSPTG